MKKSLMTLFAFVGIVFSGCVQNEIMEPETEMQTITVSAGMGTDTKAGVSDAGAFTWHENDAISVLATDGLYYTLTLSEGAGTKYAKFTGSVPTGKSITTIGTYPALVENGTSSSIYNPDTETLNFTLPAEYTYADGYANVPMVASFGEGAEEMAFKHIGALVRIPLNGMPANSKITVTAANRKIAGDFALDFDKIGTEEGVISTVSGTENNSVTVNYTATKSGQTAEINLPLPTGKYEALTVSVKNANSEDVFTKTWDLSSLTFGRANILVLDAEQVGPIGINQVYPFFVDARVFWAKAKDVEKYALYIDGAEPVIVSTEDLKDEGNMYSYMIGGGFGHKTTHTVAVAPVINGTPEATLKSEEFEFTTGDIRQLTRNTGTKFVAVGWDDVAVDYSPKWNSTKERYSVVLDDGRNKNDRGYQVQLLADDKKTVIYDMIPFNGHCDFEVAFANTTIVGKTNGGWIVIPTALTFGWLEPGKDYYFRVKTLDEVEYIGLEQGNYNPSPSDNKPVPSPIYSARGGSAWSEMVKVSTDPEHVASPNEILYEGFDDMLMNQDFMNWSVAVIPDVTKEYTPITKADYQAALKEGYPKFLNTPASERKFTTEGWHQGTLSAEQYGMFTEDWAANKDIELNEVAGSLKGWTVNSAKSNTVLAPQYGSVRLVRALAKYADVAKLSTPAITSDKLLSNIGTKCIVTLQVSFLANGLAASDIASKVVIEHCRGSKVVNSGTYDIKELYSDKWNDEYLSGGQTKDDYAHYNSYYEIKHEAFLRNGDRITISKSSNGKGGLILGEVHIEAVPGQFEESIEVQRNYGTAPDNTDYDLWGLNGVMPITFWMGPPALDQTALHTLDAATLAEYKSKYFDPMVEGGYNLIESCNPYPESMEILLNWCESAGVKLLDKSISAWNDTEGNVTRVTSYANHAAYAGIFVGKDEPSVTDFSEISAMNNAFMNALPTTSRTVNLFPIGATASQMGVNTYEEYAKTFVNQINMSDKKFHMMFDMYCLTKSDSKGNAWRGSVRGYQYQNLDMIRHLSLEKRVPFLQITHGRPQWDPGYSATIYNDEPGWTTDVSATKLPPKPDEQVYDDQRWLVWSQLALGSKGVSYFCYWTPNHFKGGPFSWTVNGEKTRMYDILKNINQEIKPIGQILMTCHADGAMITNPGGTLVMYENLGNGLDNYGPVVSLSKDGSEGVIAGCFRDASTGEYKFLVTHQAPASNDNEAATASIAKLMIDTNMATEVKLHTVTLGADKKTAATTVVTTADVSSGTLTLSIPDGTAVLVEFPETANVNYN